MLSSLARQIDRVYAFFTYKGVPLGPEDVRRSNLIVAFSMLGVLFGGMFALFYWLIDHVWGANIIAVCCVLFAAVPPLLALGVNTLRTGNLYCLILLVGFICLCWVEGGMHGHALAWLVIVPLCSLLLTSRKGAYWWSSLAFLTALATVGVETFGISPPIRYPMEWHMVVSAMGYTALIAFLFALGLVFENGRKTAQNKMESALQKLAEGNQVLTRLNQEKTEFLSIAAHDLKSPLTVVMGRADMIASTDLPQDGRVRAAGTILKEAKRMRALISNLLDLNAIEEGRMNIETRHVSLRELCESVSESQRAAAVQKEIAFTHSSTADAIALADEKALTQVVDNLVSNAIKFTPRGGSVSIETWTDAKRAWLKVSDTGPGLSAEDQTKLFGRFARLSNRPTAGESSHGLGLSIVKKLVDAMNGEIRCDSVVGRGTTFFVGLPCAAVSPPQEPQSRKEFAAQWE